MSRPPARRDVVSATAILRDLLTALPPVAADAGRIREAYLRGAIAAWTIAAPPPPTTPKKASPK